MKTTVALFTLVLAATPTTAFANTKVDLHTAISNSLHAQAAQVKQQLDQQTRQEQQRKLAEIRGPWKTLEVLIAENRQVAKNKTPRSE
jgi:succinylglutamate desuccinylase